LLLVAALVNWVMCSNQVRCVREKSQCSDKMKSGETSQGQTEAAEAIWKWWTRGAEGGVVWVAGCASSPEIFLKFFISKWRIFMASEAMSFLLYHKVETTTL